MGYYTLIKVLTYIFCSALAILVGISVYKSEKITNKVSGALFLAILLMRMFLIR